MEAEWGGIDILVNNAGIFNMASIDKVTHEDYRRQYDVNVGGTIFAMQAVVPSMKKRGGGAIINFSSKRAGAVSQIRALLLDQGGGDLDDPVAGTGTCRR